MPQTSSYVFRFCVPPGCSARAASRTVMARPLENGWPIPRTAASFTWPLGMTCVPTRLFPARIPPHLSILIRGLVTEQCPVIPLVNPTSATWPAMALLTPSLIPSTAPCTTSASRVLIWGPTSVHLTVPSSTGNIAFKTRPNVARTCAHPTAAPVSSRCPIPPTATSTTSAWRRAQWIRPYISRVPVARTLKFPPVVALQVPNVWFCAQRRWVGSRTCPWWDGYNDRWSQDIPNHCRCTALVSCSFEGGSSRILYHYYRM